MKKMTLRELCSLISNDLPAYAEPFWKSYLFIPGFRYTFHHRLCYYLSQYKLLFPLFVLEFLYMKHLTYKFGMQLAWNFRLPEHFIIAHFGGITFFPESCGSHCYLRQGVTVGAGGRGGKHPRIGSHVEFGANSIVIGDVEVGDYAKIGAAGAVVTKDVPPYSVVAGVPAKVIRTIEPNQKVL